MAARARLALLQCRQRQRVVHLERAGRLRVRDDGGGRSGEQPAAGCETPSAGFAAPNFGIPGLGASTADLKAAFGAAVGSKVSYRFDRPGGYSNIAQYLGYMLKGGKVSGIGVRRNLGADGALSRNRAAT